MSALLSVLGVLLKHSIDLRTDRRADVEHAHNQAVAQEAADRLKLEAAIEAVKLLGTPQGTLAHAAQRAGALFTLSSLGQYELILALVATFLATNDGIDASTAAKVLNDILLRGDHTHQVEAIMILKRHARRFITDDGFELPDCIIAGCVGCEQYVREWAPLVVARLLMARSVAEWKQFRGHTNTLLAALGRCWQSERDARVKANIGSILRVALAILLSPPRIVYGSRGAVDLPAISIEILDVRPQSRFAEAATHELEAWGADQIGQLEREHGAA